MKVHLPPKATSIHEKMHELRLLMSFKPESALYSGSFATVCWPQRA